MIPHNDEYRTLIVWRSEAIEGAAVVDEKRATSEDDRIPTLCGAAPCHPGETSYIYYTWWWWWYRQPKSYDVQSIDLDDYSTITAITNIVTYEVLSSKSSGSPLQASGGNQLPSSGESWIFQSFLISNHRQTPNFPGTKSEFVFVFAIFSLCELLNSAIKHFLQ